ncbi:MAG: Ketopantoate reductase PanG [Myxococcaceae bacterium]|nr:Ketopantoate reductase PanG [Myxococcaceae bacterium]
MRVCVVGRGKLGCTLQRELLRAGVDSVLVAGRDLRLPPTRDVYLLAVPDARIAELARALASELSRGSVVLHLAGARDEHELACAREHGAHVGVFHPLLSFASKHGAPSLAGATFTAFGDKRAVAAARRLAKRLGARVVVLEHAPGPAYHAAAALLANGAVALTQLAVQTLLAVGFEQRAAERALSTLLASVAANVAQLGVPAALTGPVSRGDRATVAAHLAALGQIDRKLAAHYAALQPALIATALARGLDPRLARSLQRTVDASGVAKRAQVTK